MTSPDVVRRRLRFFGAVQGVGFRYWAMREAKTFGVSGYVRNLRDGSVEAVLEGPRDEVAALENVLREGPPYGRVSRVNVADESPQGDFSSFEVRF